MHLLLPEKAFFLWEKEKKEHWINFFWLKFGELLMKWQHDLVYLPQQVFNLVVLQWWKYWLGKLLKFFNDNACEFNLDQMGWKLPFKMEIIDSEGWNYDYFKRVEFFCYKWLF